MKLKNYSNALLILVFGCVLTSFTSQKWRIIEQKEASYGSDVDVLKINGREIYTALKIRVKDAPLDIKDMDVVFENGEKIKIPIQNNFRQGEESRAIDLPGNRRRIEKIIFKYDTQGILRGRANVVVLGRR
jgi:hypothetical protein